MKLTDRRKAMLKVVLYSGFIFCRLRSLQMRIMGILPVSYGLLDHSRLTFVFLINPFKAPTPPRSPADIPSTSSMIKQVLWLILTPSITVVL